MYNYLVLDHLSVLNYKHLTYPWFQERLDQLSTSNITNIAIGVEFQGKPVGLVLAEYQKNQNQANILSLVVDPQYRRQGLGTALLIQIEELLRKFCCQQLNLIYKLHLMTSILENMLKQQNWTPGSFYSLQCLTNRETMKQAPFLHRYTIPQKFTIFPWVELTAKERTKIEQRDNKLNYPDELSPFREGKIEAISSLGVRYQEEVIAWSIFYRMLPNCVVYKSLFVKPEFRSSSLGASLIAASLNRQIADETVTEGMVIFLEENTTMTKFLNRRLAPYLTSINRFWKSSKLLQSAPVVKQNNSPVHSLI